MPRLLAVDPYFPPTIRYLKKITAFLITSGRASHGFELCPEIDHVREIFAEIYLYDIFGKIETWQNKFFKFDHISEKISDYATAYKHVTCNHVRLSYFTVLLLDRLSDQEDKKNIQLTGLPPSTEGALKAFNSRNDTGHWIKSRRLPWALINIITVILVAIFTLGWILLRTRPGSLRPKKIILAADFIDDPRDLVVLDEFSKYGGVLLVQRASEPYFTDHAKIADFKKCGAKIGIFDLFGALKAAGLVLRDIARLTRLFYSHEPAHFFKIVSLPYRRIVLRAFFNKFRPTYFWGRDDYNVEHILRRQEMHRYGGLSLGINHGFPSYANLFPQWRYISFDKYYTFGRAVYERIYKKTWAKDMEIIPVGMFGPGRDAYKTIESPKPKNIIIFCAVYVGNLEMIKVVRRLAEAFPDRTIWLQVKINYRKFNRFETFLDACTQGLDNIVYTTESPLELFQKARYAVSDASTTVIEALQFGLVSFMADICKIHEVCLYREFPGLCVTSADTIVDRIVESEAGDWSYPRENYGELVDLSKRPYVEIIVDDLRSSASTLTPSL